MNSDYKSALDKIHLEQNKKEEMKQLFRKNNMRRKINFIKPAVAPFWSSPCSRIFSPFRKVTSRR